MSPRRFWPIFFLLLLAPSAAAVWRFTGPAVRYQERVLKSFSGAPLRVVYVMPEGAEAETGRTRPAVVAIPPYSIPPEAMEVICVELARRGAVCAIPDFFGKTRPESRQHMGADSLEIMTEDVRTIVYSLWAMKCVDPRKTGVCGHSVGGTVAYLAARADPRIRAAVPIGMETDIIEANLPQNMLFLSGLYDEIHSPTALIANLRDMEVTDSPEKDELYGDFQDGTAREVRIIPTTDHFIETFDPFLIHALFDWYARSFDAPELAGGTLREFYRRVAAFFFMVSICGLYAVMIGRASAALALRLGPRQPAWIVMRLQALPLVAALAAIFFAGQWSAQFRPSAIDLMLALILAQELASHRARGVLRHGARSPFRALRSSALVLAALGVATLLGYGIVCAPYYWRWPGTAPWYPVFALEMATLFPVEVWGRLKPWFFADMFSTVGPKIMYFALLILALAVPGGIMRMIDRLAQEMMITVRAGLRPITGTHGMVVAGHEAPALEGPAAHATAGPSLIKIALLAVLLSVLIFLGVKRVREGMLNWETGWLAAESLLRFAVLPFVITFLIVRTRRFRKAAYLD
ncbi:MAG TPA: dienelactone hydrolase family protein [bacterium]|nr:dienelactone hydrolase family protein [bacterium]